MNLPAKVVWVWWKVVSILSQTYPEPTQISKGSENSLQCSWKDFFPSRLPKMDVKLRKINWDSNNYANNLSHWTSFTTSGPFSSDVSHLKHKHQDLILVSEKEHLHCEIHPDRSCSLILLHSFLLSANSPPGSVAYHFRWHKILFLQIFFFKFTEQKFSNNSLYQ